MCKDYNSFCNKFFGTSCKYQLSFWWKTPSFPNKNFQHSLAPTQNPLPIFDTPPPTIENDCSKKKTTHFLTFKAEKNLGLFHQSHLRKGPRSSKKNGAASTVCTQFVGQTRERDAKKNATDLASCELLSLEILRFALSFLSAHRQKKTTRRTWNQ